MYPFIFIETIAEGYFFTEKKSFNKGDPVYN
jgi:hypothetical protein